MKIIKYEPNNPFFFFLGWLVYYCVDAYLLMGYRECDVFMMYLSAYSARGLTSILFLFVGEKL